MLKRGTFAGVESSEPSLHLLCATLVRGAFGVHSTGASRSFTRSSFSSAPCLCGSERLCTCEPAPRRGRSSARGCGHLAEQQPMVERGQHAASGGALSNEFPPP